jgi:chromosome segregation ATPase
LLVLLLGAWGAYAGYGMYTNHERAQQWQQRSVVIKAQADKLGALLGARTRQLNSRIDQLSEITGKLKRTQAALGRSQGDVSSLEQRQRELAAEKAQVEDERAALKEVAAAYIGCKNDLISVLTDITNDDYYTAQTDADQADYSCQAADDSLSGYSGG